MSRIDQAMRRAQQGRAIPLSDVPTASALHKFPEGLEPGSPSSPQKRDSIEGLEWSAPQPGRRLTGASQRHAERLVISSKIRHDSAQQYRRLGATLHQAACERQFKSLVVTSALPGEGKTLTVVNVALTMSESYGRRVLLIDADLRRPTVHELFHIPNDSGLGEVLGDGPERSPRVVSVSSCLTILPAGHPDRDPVGGLTSERMRKIIQAAAAQYDWVFIDTPPVGLLPDANLLMSMVDGVLWVIRANSTPFAAVERAMADLDRERIVGVVLNQVDDKALGEALPYYSDYYGASHDTGTRDALAMHR